MPVFHSRTVFELARGLKAFLKVEAGLTREALPQRGPEAPAQPAARDAELARLSERLVEREREIAGLRERLAVPRAGGIDPRNVVWIFCSNRSGSTWLSSMMGEIEGHEVWNEPLVGKLFGELYYVGAEGHQKVKQYILGDYYKGSWLDSIQAFVLSEAGTRFPGVAEKGYLIIKEPNGSIGAPLLAEAMPASRVIFLVRDPRDVAASGLDAARKGSWQYENAAEGPELRAPRGESQGGLRGPQGTQGPAPLRRVARRHSRHHGAPLLDARDRGRDRRPPAGGREALLGEHTGRRQRTGEVLPQGHAGKLAGRPDPRSGRDSGAGLGPAVKRVLPGLTG
jgi:hypothetical protein